MGARYQAFRPHPALRAHVAWPATGCGGRRTTKRCHYPDTRTDSLARALGLTRQHLGRIFLEHTGLSPKSFGRIARLQRVLPLVRDPAVSLAAAAMHAGYADQAHLCRDFKALVGQTPRQYRQGH